MRKTLLLTTCFITIVSLLIAAPVDTLTSKRVASNFYRERAGVQHTRSANPLLVKTYKVLPNDARDSVNCLYIYNVGEGYVIVCADDRITPVLGYSTESNFDVQQTPIQLQEWLSQYVAEISAAVSSPTFTNEGVASSWRALASENYTPSRYGSVVVAPLVQTHWNQSPRYNNYCPYDASAGERTVTGCVATAMAQLLRYWMYPPQGIGSHSYTHGTYGVQSANFGATTYNYSLMPLQLSSSSSAAEIEEVAKLSYHCGVSVDMNYNLSANGGSGANTADAANAFNTYFGYSGCQYLSKSDFTNYQWKTKLKTELNNGRPVLYSGSGSGGHAFICDGYTADEYFHFNFGWGGYQDGYFLLDNITPSGNNFSYTQAGIFNLSAAVPILRASVNEINFLVESGTSSEGRRVYVITHNLSNALSISINSPFAVSTDSVHYSTSVSLPSGGGSFFVRYQPSVGLQADSANVTITSGSSSTTVSLKGFTYTINCLPVNNLNITSSDLSHINIAWTEPQMDTAPQILTWNDAKTTNYSFNDNKVTLLQRFTTADLASHHGQTLTGISFYVTSGFSVLKLVAYEGSDFSGSSFNPGTLIMEQNIPVSSLSENSWNTFTLTNPVTIDAHQELCFGVYMESSYDYPIPVGSPIVAKKGGIVGYTYSSGGQGWSQISNYSVCLRGIIHNTQSVTHYEVSRNGTLLGTTTATSYNDVVSHTDTYHYTVTAVWDNGCSSSAQVNFTNVASIIVNPQMLEFHNNYGFNNEVKSIQVGGNGISQPIQISVSGNFQISTNGTSYSTSASLPSSGGVLYVKYTPAATSTTFENGQINLSSGSVSARVSLTGQCYGDCNPPENLTLSTSGSTTSLNWSAPTYTPNPPSTLSWCTTFGYYYSWAGNDGSLDMAHRFEPSDLGPYHNKRLTSISFATPIITTLTSCKIIIYKGGSFSGSYGTSGSLVYEQSVNVSSLSTWNWNTITLNTPVTIDASQELWFGVHCEYSGEAYYLCFNDVSVPQKGWISHRNTNSYWSYSSGSSFALKATVEDAPLTLSRYQIDRNSSTIVPNTTATNYSDNVGTNGNYDYTVWAIWSNGCQAGANGSVTITGGCDNAGIATTISECGSYTWHGHTYTASGNYTYSYTDSHGCTQVDTLHLTIHSAPTVTISGNTSICSGASTTLTASGANSYTWSTGASGSSITVHPTSSTPYTVTGTDGHGCTGNATVTVTITPASPATVTTANVTNITSSTATCGGTVTADACSPVTARGVCWSTSHNPTVSGSHITSGTGTGTFTSNLTGLAENTTYYVRAYATTAAGTQYGAEKSFKTGCGAVTVTISGNTSICSGASTTLTASGANSYIWSTGTSGSSITVNPTSSTPYTVTGTNSLGCTGNTTVTITVTTASLATVTTANVTNITTSTATCGGTVTADACSPVTARGVCWSTSHNPTITGNHTTNGTGTGTFTSNLTGLAENTTYYVRAYATTAAGTQYGAEKTFKTNCGVHELTVSGNTTIYSGTSTTLYASGANSYHWYPNNETTSSITVSPSTTSTYTVIGTMANGCSTEPATITVTVTSCIPAQGIVTASACGSYTWHGHTYTASTNTATYTVPNGAASGCDSIVTLHLTIYNPVHTAVTVSECGSYTWHGHTYTASGNYTYSHTDAHGCTQVDTLHLTIKPVPVVTITGNTSINLYGSTTLTAHGASSYVWSTGSHSSAVTVSPSATTTYSVTGTTDGCASAPASVTVTVGDCIPLYNIVTVTACNSYTWQGITYTESTNTPTHTFPNGASNGCDSIVNLHLIIIHSTNNSIFINECGSYTWGGTTYTTSGTYTHEYSNSLGCTLVDTLHLTITPIPVVTISGDTIIHLHESTFIMASGAGSYIWSNGLSSAGFVAYPTTTTTYTVTGFNNWCASEPVSITVHVEDCIPAQGVETVTACGSYTWHGHTYTASTNTATYTVPNGAASGCDSIVTLHLTIHNPQHSATTITECGSYTWHGHTYTSSGNYTYSHTDAHGCTQVDTLHLTIRPVPVVTITGNTSIHRYESTTLTAHGASTYVWSNGSHNSVITVSPASTTTYSVTGYADGCTSELASVTVTVGDCIPAQGVETISACGSYTWHGHTYTASTSTPTYTIPGGAASGCDSIVTLHLTIHNPQHEAYNVTECGSYTWADGNGQTYTQSGTYLHSHIDANGCTQVDTLHLTLQPRPVVTITGNTAIHLYENTTLTAHGASTYIWSTGQSRTAITVAPAVTTTYSVTGYADGCTSEPASVTVTVGDCIPAQGVETVTACGSYTWHGHTYTASTSTPTYTILGGAVTGCDSIVTLHLTIKSVPVVSISGNTFIHLYENTTLTANGANSYIWSNGSHNSTITVAPATTTTYSVTGTTDGCSSQPASVTVVVGACIPAQGVETVTACESHTWHGHTYYNNTTTQTFTIAGGAATGCDSIVTLHLIVYHPQHTSTTITQCDSYTWTAGDGHTYTQSGTYLYRHTDANGCTQVDTLHLTVFHPQHTVLTVTECNSYTWTAGDGHTYTQSGNYLYSHTDTNGCTQVDTLHLTVFHPQHTSLTVIECNSYTWTAGDGHTYTQSGNYLYSHSDANGCTQVDTLHLTVFHPQHMSLTASECNNYTWTTGDGHTYTQSGDYLYSHSDANGCTQVDTLHLTLFHPQHTALTVTECNSYTWTSGDGQTYTQSGDYFHSHTDAHGCTQVDTLHLTLFHPQHTSLTASECNSYTWTAGDGHTYTQSGDYLYSHTDSNGCTQVDTLHLTVFHPQHTSLTIIECNSYTWAAGDGHTYTQSGDYLHIHSDSNGCTQVDTLHLTLFHPQHTALTVTECNSYTWAAGDGHTYTQSGDYLHIHSDANGCTQVDTLHLTIKPIPLVTITGNGFIHLYESTTLSAHGADSYVWSTGAHSDAITVTPSSTTTYSVTGQTDGCTSTPASITVEVGPCVPAQGVENITTCGSFTWHGQTYYSSSTATHTIPNGAASGCDSIVTLHLTIFHPQHTSLTITECNSYTWTSGNGQTYTQSGTYFHSHADSHGCTQVDTLHLTVFHPQHNATTVTECDSYIWTAGNGHSYFQSGTYLHSHTDANGCTQVDTLHLTIKPIPAVTITGNVFIHLYESSTLTAHGADSYVWSTGAHSDAITVSPTSATTYSVTGYADGCTSAPASVTVNVGACIPAQGVETVTACSSHTWHGTTYTASTNTPTFTIHNGAASGCDSIVTLHLTIHHAQHTATTANECGSYTWAAGDGQTYTQSGTYLHSHTDANGCTQVDTLHLTIRPVPVVTISGSTAIHLYESTTLTASGANSYSWSTGASTDAITVSPATTTTYTVTGTTDGCASTPASVTVTVGPCIPAQGVETVTACESYTWHGQTYYESIDTATHTVTGGAATGCDSIVTLHLTIHHAQHTATTASECGNYIWTAGDGQTYTQSGTYLYTHTDTNGCTQVDTLLLTIHEPQSSEFTVATEDSCYVWNGTEYCENGDFIQTLTDLFGCDSTVTLHLTLRVGVTQYDEQYDLTIYPNPTSGILHIESGTNIGRLHLYNAFGQKIKSRLVNGAKGSLDLSDLATGTYFIRVETDKGVVVKKVIKNR